MKPFAMGLMSPRNFYIHTFNKRFLLLLTVLMLEVTGFSTPNQQVPPAESGHHWTVSIHLDCPSNAQTHISAETLFQQLPGMEGFTASTKAGPNGEILTFTLSGPAINLPPHEDIAIILVDDPDCGSSTIYRIHTSGAGVILLLDEF